MLAKEHRLTRPADFSSTIRDGGRCGSRTLVAHLSLGEPSSNPVPARVGLVVSKGVGNAVTRNQVKRRLRHLARARIDGLPNGSTLVLRALPASAEASSDSLDQDLAHTLGRAQDRVGGKGARA